MRTLNKTLALVLALVMVLGMFGVATAADFTDDETIQYKEAVGVMTGIGAINGMGDGTFAPAGNVTRAQAAKMVAYAVLGADVAAALPTMASSFTDVDANFAWAIPSIEYLVKEGVINGRGDGTFDPNGNVTAYEIAKMLLAAAGYGQNGEFTGNSWALNVAVVAQKNRVFTGTKATDLNAAATREECALYCFSGLTKVAQVNWSKDEGAYVSAEKGTIAAEVHSLDTEEGIIVENQATGNDDTVLADDSIYETETGLNLLGHYVEVFYNEKTDDVYYVNDLSTTVTVAKEITKATDFTKAFGEKAPAAADTVQTFDETWTVTGTAKAAFEFTVNDGVDAAQPGVYVVYDKEIVSYLQPLAESATVMGAVSKDGKTVDIGVVSDANVDNVVYTAAVEEDDVILVREIGSMYYVSPAATVTGAYTAKTADNNTITVDGNKLTVTALCTDIGTGLTNVAVSDLVFGETYTVYLDGYGSFFAVTADESVAVTSDYFYGVETFANEIKDAYNVTTTLTKLQVVDMNGEVSNVVVGVEQGLLNTTMFAPIVGIKDNVLAFSDVTLSDLSAFGPKAPEILAKLKAVGFKKVDIIVANPTTDDDGVLTVIDDIDFDLDTASLSATQIDEGKAYLTANTNYIFVDSTLADIDVTTITGGINQTILQANIKAIVASKDAMNNFVINAIFIDDEHIQDTNDYLFLADDGQTAVVTGTGSTYEFYNMAGEATDYIVAKGTTMPAAVGFYSYTVTDGVYTLTYMDAEAFGLQYVLGSYSTNATTGLITSLEPLTTKVINEDFSVIGAKLVDLTEDGTRGSFTKFEGGESVYVLADTVNEAFKTIFVIAESKA